jgi:hypothetical protein
MTDLITQNPIVALVLVIVPVAAVMWKVFHALYVKPRDFRIDMLKEDMARLNSQLEELRNLPRETSLLRESGHVDGPAQAEAPPNGSKTLEKLPRAAEQSAESPPRPADRTEQHPTNSQPLERSSLTTAKPAQGSKSPADSLAALYEQWSDPSITKLQKQKFEQDWIEKDVRWLVWVDSVGEVSHGRIFVNARDGPSDNYAAPRAILICPERDAGVLLSVRPGDAILVSGKIHEFFIIPTVDVSTIERA